MHWSYNLGTAAVSTLTAHATEFTHAASMLGVFAVGALTCNYGATYLGMVIPNGEASIDVQGLLNGILPALIPLLLTLMCYFLIKKKGWTATKCIGLLLILGIVGCMLGVWSGSYTSLIPVPWHE